MATKLQSAALIAVFCALFFSQIQANILSPNNTGQSKELNSDLDERDILFWQEIKNSTFPEDFEAYLDQFPNGIFVTLAKIRLERLQETETPSEPSPRGGSTKRHSTHPVNVNDHLICTPQTRPNAVYSGCWMRIQNQVSCYLWNSKYFGDYTVTWNGQCLNNIAHGSGTYIWTVSPFSPHLPLTTNSASNRRTLLRYTTWSMGTLLHARSTQA